MNVRQVNLESLHEKFFENPRLKGIAKFVQKYPENESSSDLEELLRDHEEEGIEDPWELDMRDSLDSLLSYYSLLEVASIIDYVPPVIEDGIKLPALRILRQPDVKRFYRNHYRSLLPELFRYRLEKVNTVREHKGLNEASAIFAQFLTRVGEMEDSANVSMFLWFLDDGIQNGCNWTDLLDPLERPDRFFRVLLRPKKDEKTLSVGLNGLLTFVQTCRELDCLLNSADKWPLFQSAMWHFHSYWFVRLKRKIGSELKTALRKFESWERYADDPIVFRTEIKGSLKEIDRALKDLLSARYGTTLHTMLEKVRKSARGH